MNLLLEDKEFQEEIKAIGLDNKQKLTELYKDMIYYDLEYYYYNEMYQSLGNLYCLLDTELYNFYKDDDEMLDVIDYYDAIPKSYYDDKEDIMHKESLESNYDINEKIMVKELKINH